MKEKLVHVSGRKKTCVARATLKSGKGVVRINSRLLDTYDDGLMKDRIMEPLVMAGDLANKVNIYVNVKGGGWSAQTEATRLAIARALVEYSQSKQLKKTFLDYDRNMLVADVRQAESSKPNDSKPRKKRQKSYR